MHFKHLNIFWLIILILCLIEVSLEYRAHLKGFDTILFENKNKSTKKDTPGQIFRSKSIPLPKPSNTIRLWMASASYAADPKRKIEELFPNILCDDLNLSGTRCQILNASAPGLTIKENTDFLRDNGDKWGVDYTILYSMNIDINELSKKYFASTQDKPDTSNIDDLGSFSLATYLNKFLESTTLYSHLRNYIGGSILLESQLHDSINENAITEFRNSLNEFITVSKSLGSTPILVTFSTKYHLNSKNGMPHSEKLFLVRYNEYLSETGWYNTISRFNQEIINTAYFHNIPYIELNIAMHDRPELFSDFVHFTKNGHIEVGLHLSRNMKAIHSMANKQ